MKLAILGSLLLVLSGCADMSPTQKRVAGAVAGVLVVGAIVAYQADHGSTSSSPAAISKPSLPCAMQRDGTCR